MSLPSRVFNINLIEVAPLEQVLKSRRFNRCQWYTTRDLRLKVFLMVYEITNIPPLIYLTD